MNIGYIYELKAYPPRGGNHRHAYELVQGFNQQGHKVSVLDDPTMPNAANYPSSDLSAFLAHVDVLYIRIDGRLTIKSEAINTAMAKVTVPVIWEINAPANESLAFSWLGGQTTGQQESLFRRLRRRLHALRQLPKIYREERHRTSLAKKVDAAICVSESLRRYATEQLGIGNTLVVPNGGPLLSQEEIQRRRNKRKSEQFTVLYSGSAIYPWQGMQYIFDAVKLAQSTAPDIKFLLAVNQRTAFLPDSSNVEIREGLDREGILDAICQSDVCIALHPEYFWSKWKFHGSPMKLFEYMAGMTASLSSNLGQMQDLIHHRENGLLCENDAADILRHIMELQADKALRDRVAFKGWEKIQTHLNWPHNAKRTTEVFEQLVRTRNTNPQASRSPHAPTLTN